MTPCFELANYDSGVFTGCYVQLTGVWRCAGVWHCAGVWRCASGSGTRNVVVCATQPPVFTRCWRKLWTGGGVLESPDLSTITSRFSPLRLPVSSVVMEAVESPTPWTMQPTWIWWLYLAGGTIWCLNRASRRREPPTDLIRVSRVPLSDDNLSWGGCCFCWLFVWGTGESSPFSSVSVHRSRPGCYISSPSGLQRDAGLMASNLAVINQYVITLRCMSTEVLQSVSGQEFFHAHAVEDTAPVPRILRASTQMAAMGLWRSPGVPVGLAPAPVHQAEDCPGCSMCPPRLSG